jgi:hypothetical protein
VDYIAVLLAFWGAKEEMSLIFFRDVSLVPEQILEELIHKIAYYRVLLCPSRTENATKHQRA